MVEQLAWKDVTNILSEVFVDQQVNPIMGYHRLNFVCGFTVQFERRSRARLLIGYRSTCSPHRLRRPR